MTTLPRPLDSGPLTRRSAVMDRTGRNSSRSLIVAANRLPVHRAGSRGSGRWESAAGGLVTALTPVLKRMPGAWIGWPGGDQKVEPFEHDGVRIRPVSLGRDDVDRFYNGMSNRTLWPLYHDAIRPPEFREDWWDRYVKVNSRFAAAIADAASPGDLVWIHDYHLQLAPAMVRNLRSDVRIGFFLHIPFPPEELFEWLPWRAEILDGLLGADVVGFQTEGAARNFAGLCRTYTRARGPDAALSVGGREVRCGAFPISIDFDWFDSRARAPATRRRVVDLRRRFGPDRKILLAIDRLDYTKGIIHRLEAYEHMLERGLADAERCVLVQIATPSRDAVKDYAVLRDDVERAVGRINGRFSNPGRVAVHYFRRNLKREELVAFYAAADVMLVTPLRDGMNLVAKEYVACRTDGRGVLVLSDFAGAARELSEAILVNPRDRARFAGAIQLALEASPTDMARRMASLRRWIGRHTVFDWSGGFVDALRGAA